MKQLENTHDLRLPAWGPYTKKYIGISHVPDISKGFRFDLSVFPGFYRRKVDVPSVMWESGYHPWNASADLSFIEFRHELEWKDRVYADIAYIAQSENARTIRCRCVNETDDPQTIVLHLLASLHAPQVRGHGDALEPALPSLPAFAVWKDALDYDELRYAAPRPSDGLVYDGWRRGEFRAQRFVGGAGLGRGFGQDEGDTVRYTLAAGHPVDNAMLALRYRMTSGETATFRVAAGGERHSIVLSGTGDLALAAIPLRHRVPAGCLRVELVSAGGAPVELDGLALLRQEDAARLAFEPVAFDPVPQRRNGPRDNSVILKYSAADTYYGLLWFYGQSEVRELYTSELDRFMRHTVHDHVNETLRGDGNGHYTNVFLRPIALAPRQSRTVYAYVCSGSLKQVEAMLRDCALPEAADESPTESWRVTPAGEPYRFGARLLAATLATNVVYPVYTKGGYIRHYTPGRWWDSLYTWDSGFIGLGLLELDIERATDCLNAYVTEPGDTQTAFIHHGSMVPVQHYLFLELWNRTQSLPLLRHFYPRLKQYYDFYCGHAGRSTTRVLQSGLLKTWDYFYNSGGWDDYPPQAHVHLNKLDASVAPISNTCHAIRIAKILKQAALALDADPADIQGFERDIALFSGALEHGWDEASGYYGYVAHDASGRPRGILRHAGGENFNKGLDGVYPLVAGVCDAERTAALLRHMESEDALWSPIGLSTVDRSAAYYRTDGYWNGAVWMAHQWFMWKTMLDAGRADLAWRIASTALALWERETERTYSCFEHFMIENGRGAGWHQFGGLSAPVLSWFAACYRPGTVTAGFDVWIESKHWNEDGSALRLRLSQPVKAHASTLLVCVKPGGSWRAAANGRDVACRERLDGLLELTLEPSAGGALTLLVEMREDAA